MARSLSGSLAVLLLSTASFTGCHCCGTDCEVTKICSPECKTEKIEKEGWDVECEQIGIPPVHCPFSDPCQLSCGRVIAVKRLKEDKLECGERCVIEYKLIDACPNCEAGGTPEESADPKDEAPPAPAPESGEPILFNAGSPPSALRS